MYFLYDFVFRSITLFLLVSKTNAHGPYFARNVNDTTTATHIGTGTATRTGFGPSIVPFIVKATDGSDRSTAITWSGVKTGSISTTDKSGQPTVITAPFWTCSDPLCKGTGCLIAILCTTEGGGAIGFEGFPPPGPPLIPPPKADGSSPSGSASQNPSTTGTPTSSPGPSASSAKSSSSSGSCVPITTVADPGPTPAGGSDDSNLRFRLRTLMTRAEPPFNRIGTCALTREVRIPSYLRFGSAMKLDGTQRNVNGGANGRIYDAIEKWYTENLAVNGDPFSWDKEDHVPKSPMSIDHVWEKSNIGDFLASLLGPNFDCEDLNALFSCGNKLQKIFDQLPSMNASNIQSGFAAMGRYLNGMKGWMFSQGFAEQRFQSLYDEDQKIIQGLERQAIVFDLFNTDSGIQSMHDQVNNRIYSAFLAIDDYILTNKIQRASNRGDLTQRFGPSFKTWYEQLLKNMGTGSYNWASGQVTRLNMIASSLSDCLQKAIITFQTSPLYGSDKFQIDQTHLSWTASPIVLKRDVLFERDEACTLPNNSGAAPNESIVCQDPGQASFQLIDAVKNFDEFCAHFDGQVYPPTTALRDFYDNHAGVWVELWSTIAADENCKQGEVKFSQADCLTALNGAASKCNNDDGTSTGGNAEAFNCAEFGFIGNNHGPTPGVTSAAVTNSQPTSTASVVAPDPSESVASASRSAADASWSAAAATPSAGCWILNDDGFGTSSFQVYGINDWAGDGGDKLFKQEAGCGILNYKGWQKDIVQDFQGRLRHTQTATFSLTFFKGGCVERAVHSAGGPLPGHGTGQLACQHGGP